MNFFNHFEKLGTDFFSKITTTPLENSFVAAYSPNACALLDFDPAEFLKPDFCKFTNPNFCNLAMLYAGHQFGHFVPQLGDGRAALLAQITNQKNESWDLVLKGAGLTPYSRMGDGKAVLRSSIREFLVSEAMFHLGIPTSRALCLIASDEKIHRDGMEKAAQIIRLAPSHVRFGSFEVFFYRKQNEQIKILADYLIERHPELSRPHHTHSSPHHPNTPPRHPELVSGSQNKYANLLATVVESTAKLIAKWQAFGFCHGVLNTDNMSIVGITFDYGPFGFLDAYNPHHICNHSDFEGRYSFANQPAIGLWNLHAFAITLSSLVSMEEQKEILANYEKIFYQEYHNLMAQKLGFASADENTKKLTHEVLDLLEKHQIDYTIFFRGLSALDPVIRRGDTECGFAPHALSTTNPLGVTPSNDGVHFEKWHDSYFNLVKTKNISEPDRKFLIKKSNPKFILRNHLLQTAIEKADLANDFSEVKKLLKIMQNPFDEQPENESYANLPPAWAKEISISCSS